MLDFLVNTAFCISRDRTLGYRNLWPDLTLLQTPIIIFQRHRTAHYAAGINTECELLLFEIQAIKNGWL